MFEISADPTAPLRRIGFFLGACLVLCSTLIVLAACGEPTASTNDQAANDDSADAPSNLLSKYTDVRLDTDAELSEAHKQMIPLLIDAAKEMDAVFWQQAYGDRDTFLDQLSGDSKRFAEINYGPWDRLDGNEPFVEGVEAKPAGANLYPADITKEELTAAVEAAKESRI